MNPFGILTNMGPGETPQYHTFGLSGRDPYGLPSGVGPREPHYNPFPFHSSSDYRGLPTRHGFSDHDIMRMQFQLTEVAFNRDYYQNRDPYMEYDGFRREMTPYNTDSNELISQFGEQFRYR